MATNKKKILWGALALAGVFAVFLMGTRPILAPVPAEPTVAAFDPVTADEQLLALTQIEFDTGHTPELLNPGYTTVAAFFEISDDLVAQLSSIGGPTTQTIAIIAQLKSGDAPARSLPLGVIDTKTGQTTYLASTHLVPPYPLQTSKAALAEISVRAVFLKSSAAPITELANTLGEVVLKATPPRAEGMAALLSDTLARLDNLLSGGTTSADLGKMALTPKAPEATLVFRTTPTEAAPPQEIGSITFRQTVHPALFSIIANGGTFGDPRNAMALATFAPSLDRFWAADADALATQCAILADDLNNILALAPVDAAAALWAMIQPHAMFNNGFDYRTDCLPEATLAKIEALGLTLPGDTAPAKPQASANTTLVSVARGLVSGAPADHQASVAKLFAPVVVIDDPYGLIAPASNGLSFDRANSTLHAATSPDEAAQYLLSLPVDRFACFSRGRGQLAYHRAALLTMKNDPTLWVMDVAFNPLGKIAGMALVESTQADLCRALAGRTTSCYFGTTKTTFPGIDAAKC